MRVQMIKDKTILAIIPARAGSKRVKEKNTRELAGKPLINWTIESAKKSKYIDEIFVSTDSVQIQEIAKSQGVTCDQLRSEKLSSDTAQTRDVIIDLLERKKDFDIVILLQPTSPFRMNEDIDQAIEMYLSHNAKSIVSVCETECHVSWMIQLGENSQMDNIVNNLEQKRSQDLESFHQLNGAIYIMGKKDFLKEKTFYLKEGTYGYKMSRLNSIDIDTEEDFIFAWGIAKEFFGDKNEP